MAGLYAAATGAEKLIAGWRRGRSSPDPAARAAARRAAALGLAIAAASLAVGAGVHHQRGPYWRAVRALSAGVEASAKLREIAERQTAAMQEGASGQAALEAWRRSVERALPLRDAFASARDGARWLDAHGPASLKERALGDARFFDLCLEWIDLYALIDRALREESMERPPDEWAILQDGIVERIQSLPEPAEAVP